MKACDNFHCENYINQSGHPFSDGTNCKCVDINTRHKVKLCSLNRKKKNNMKTTKEMIEVMQAEVDGKTIEVTDNRSGWIECALKPTWDWSSCDYRVKPEPVWRPWRTMQEVPVGKIVVPKGMNFRRLLISSVLFLDGQVTVVTDDGSQSAKAMFEKYNMDDGMPCGVKE